MNNLLIGLVSIGLIAIMILMIIQLYHFRKQLRTAGEFQKERKKYLEKLRLGAEYIDNYIISLEKPTDLAEERCINIVTNLREIIVANRRTIDSYFDKFNKLDRKIKKIESKVKRHESQKDSQKIRINISMRNDLYIATSEDLLGLFVADKNIIDLFNEIPEVIKAIKYETRRDNGKL